jgi:hypothetical protein
LPTILALNTHDSTRQLDSSKTLGLINRLCTGIFAYLGIGFTLILLRRFWVQVNLPWEARRAASLVLAWFRERFPEERIDGVAVRAIEPERYVIAVRHGFGMPTPRSYFGITRPDLTEIKELPEPEWWPRGLK